MKIGSEDEPLLSIRPGHFSPTGTNGWEKKPKGKWVFILKNISFNQLNLIGASEFNQKLARNPAFQGPGSLSFFATKTFLS